MSRGVAKMPVSPREHPFPERTDTMKTLSHKIAPQDAPPTPAAAANGAAQEAALFEALWRADELAAACDSAQRGIALLEGKLARAEETIAELGEIGDAAQAAIDRLRARLTKREAEARLFAGDRAALAAELYQQVRRAAIELDEVAGELFHARREREARSHPRRRGLWQEALRRFHFPPLFFARRLRGAVSRPGS